MHDNQGRHRQWKIWDINEGNMRSQADQIILIVGFRSSKFNGYPPGNYFVIKSNGE